MILNAFSISVLFLSLLSTILMAWAGILSFRLARRWRKSSKPVEKNTIEERSHLVLLIAGVVLGIRLLNWPLFYATLQSFIPEITGAMCIFGVTQVKPTITWVSEALKPLAFFLIGAWLLMNSLDQSTRTAPLLGKKLHFLGTVSIVVILESLMDFVLFLQLAPETLISCCTTVTDMPERPTRLLPQSILGPDYSLHLYYIYFGSTLLLLGLLALSWQGMRRYPYLKWRRPVLGSLFLYAFFNAFLFLLALVEVFAPRIMGLPFHHCLYCLWQYVPDSILMMFLYVLGTFAIGWAFLLDLTGRTGETLSALPTYLRRLYGLSVFCLAASLLMLTIHLVVS